MILVALSENQVILYHHVRQDVITWQSDFHIENDLYHFRIPTAEDAEERRAENQVSDTLQTSYSPELHQFQLRRNLLRFKQSLCVLCG